MNRAVRIGSIVRFKQGKGNFLGIVKGKRVFGDERISGDGTVVLDVFWMHDPGLNFRPLVDEIEVLS